MELLISMRGWGWEHPLIVPSCALQVKAIDIPNNDINDLLMLHIIIL